MQESVGLPFQWGGRLSRWACLPYKNLILEVLMEDRKLEMIFDNLLFSDESSLEKNMQNLLKQKKLEADKTGDEDVKKKLKEVEEAVEVYKQKQVAEKIKQTLKDGYDSGEYSKEEYEQMIAEPGDQD